MKKTTLALAALALVFSTSAFAAAKKKHSNETTSTTKTRAQGASIPFARVIPQISLIMSSAVGDAAQNFNGKTGFGFGGVVDIGHSSFVIETGLLYRNLGITAETVNGTANLNLAYLTIPVNAKYYFMGAKAPISVFAKGGIMPGFNIGSSVEIGGKTYSLKNANTPSANGFEFALDLGTGAKIAMSDNLDIYSELSYARSLNQALSNVEASNSAFTIQAGMAVEL